MKKWCPDLITLFSGTFGWREVWFPSKSKVLPPKKKNKKRSTGHSIPKVRNSFPWISFASEYMSTDEMLILSEIYTWYIKYLGECPKNNGPSYAQNPPVATKLYILVKVYIFHFVTNDRFEKRVSTLILQPYIHLWPKVSVM